MSHLIMKLFKRYMTYPAQTYSHYCRENASEAIVNETFVGTSYTIDLHEV